MPAIPLRCGTPLGDSTPACRARCQDAQRASGSARESALLHVLGQGSQSLLRLCGSRSQRSSDARPLPLDWFGFLSIEWLGGRCVPAAVLFSTGNGRLPAVV
jgi:hypothetical protein